MLAHSRSKNGVASLAYAASHPRLEGFTIDKTWMAGTSLAMTAESGEASRGNKAASHPDSIFKQPRFFLPLMADLIGHPVLYGSIPAFAGMSGDSVTQGDTGSNTLPTQLLNNPTSFLAMAKQRVEGGRRFARLSHVRISGTSS
jgi:hypothetical protein